MKVCGKSHQFCGICGKSWHLCADPTYTSAAVQPREVQWSYAANCNEADWEDAAWNQAYGEGSQWSAPPKRRQTPRRRSRKAKASTAETPPSGKGKGRHKQLENEAVGPPSIASLAAADPPWLTSLLQQQPVVPAPNPNPPEDKQIKSIMAALRKHNDALPPELQAFVSEAAQKEGQQETKQMHHAVTAHGKAKKELQQAQMARLNLHAAWRGFLGHAVNLWQGYSAQFVEQEKQMADRVAAATEALESAKVNLAQSKQAAGVEVKEDSMTISEDDTDKDVSGQAAERIKEGICNLHTSLEALKSSAEQMVEEEHKALKRPRLDASPTDVVANAHPANTGFG